MRPKTKTMPIRLTKMGLIHNREVKKFFFPQGSKKSKILKRSPYSNYVLQKNIEVLGQTP